MFKVLQGTPSKMEIVREFTVGKDALKFYNKIKKKRQTHHIETWLMFEGLIICDEVI